MHYSFRFIPQRALIRDMIAEGTIGPVKSLSLKFHRNDFHIWPKAWYYDPLQAGALLLTGSHLIDSARYLSGGKIVSVSASLYKSGDTVTGFIIAMKTDSDLDIRIDVSHQIAGSGKHLIEVCGKDGCILLNEEEKVILRQQGTDYIYSIPEQYYYGFDEQVWRGNPRLQPTARVIGKVLRQISTYELSGLAFSEAVINQAIIESIILSDEQRKSIEVDYK
jgi:predicted dehydrogenase